LEKEQYNMNPYVKNLNRIEFVVTMACTGRCKHCSEGEHTGSGAHIDGAIAAEVVRRVCGSYEIKSMMTFGGEPLLYPEAVYQIHRAAKEMGIPKRQLITNGYFSKNEERIGETAKNLAESGVNDILLSVDAFHQESIPLDPVLAFAKAMIATGVRLRTSPAWLVSEEDDNPYNQKTREIVRVFDGLGIASNEGNVIFPAGNALLYLKEYFQEEHIPENPYEEDPKDIKAISVSPEGRFFEGNVYQTDILEILEGYVPGK